MKLNIKGTRRFEWIIANAACTQAISLQILQIGWEWREKLVGLIWIFPM